MVAVNHVIDIIENHKLLKDLKELAEYDQSTSTDRSIFLNDNEDHPVQNRESPENSFEENVVSKTNQEPPQDSNICQLIREECCIEVPEQQKQKMEDTMFDLEQEVKNVEEQSAERRNRIEKSLQNFRVIHKSSISLNTSQISSIHEVAPILSTKEPENSLSMGYEHLSITPETESDEVIESNAKNLLPIPSKYEVTSEDKRECDELVCDNHFDTFSDSKIDDDILVYDNDFEDIEYVEASLLNPKIVSIEEENVFEDSPLIPQPPPEPIDVETDVGEEIAVVMNDKDKFDDDYQIFMFDKDYPPEIEVILCWIYVRFPRSSYPLINFSLGKSISF
nr:hypothetical protein [Tanacetum cinerariifolium]